MFQKYLLQREGLFTLVSNVPAIQTVFKIFPPLVILVEDRAVLTMDIDYLVNIVSQNDRVIIFCLYD